MTTDIGSADSAYAIAIQADGKIVVAGDADMGTSTSADYDIALVRYLGE